jgi:hypothetical protein
MVVCAAISASKSRAMAKFGLRISPTSFIRPEFNIELIWLDNVLFLSTVLWILTGREHEPSSLAAARLA